MIVEWREMHHNDAVCLGLAFRLWSLEFKSEGSKGGVKEGGV